MREAVVLTTRKYPNYQLLVGSVAEAGGWRKDMSSVLTTTVFCKHWLCLEWISNGTSPRLWPHAVDTAGFMKKDSDGRTLFYSFPTDERLYIKQHEFLLLVFYFRVRKNEPDHLIFFE